MRVIIMKEINIEQWNRKKIYEWFKNFSNTCWSITKEIGVSDIVKYSKESKSSFFINFLYVLVKTLNGFECTRMRYVNGKPVIYDSANPAYTVAKDDGTYDNLRHAYIENYNEFYSLAHEKIEKVKKGLVETEDYNPENCYDEYYITCLPWTTFSNINQPLPDDKGSQSIPRICWGQYFEKDDKIFMDFNITVSHMFCDGRDVSMFLIKLQENLNNIEDIIK